MKKLPLAIAFGATVIGTIVILEIFVGNVFFIICCVIWIVCTVFRMLTGK